MNSLDLPALREAMHAAVRMYAEVQAACWTARRERSSIMQPVVTCHAAHVALDTALTVLLDALPVDDLERSWIESYQSMLRRTDLPLLDRSVP